MEEYHVCRNKSGYQTLAAGVDKKYFFVMLGFAVMVYFPLISQRLSIRLTACGMGRGL